MKRKWLIAMLSISLAFVCTFSVGIFYWFHPTETIPDNPSASLPEGPSVPGDEEDPPSQGNEDENKGETPDPPDDDPPPDVSPPELQAVAESTSTAAIVSNTIFFFICIFSLPFFGTLRPFVLLIMTVYPILPPENIEYFLHFIENFKVLFVIYYKYFLI